jgi:hypothetical protein
MLNCHRSLGLENGLLLSYLYPKIVYQFITSISALENPSISFSFIL